MTTDPVFAVDPGARRRTNADVIADCHRLGYITDDMQVLDATHGSEGGFWKKYRPRHLTAADINAAKSPIGFSLDYRMIHRRWQDHWDVIALDPPYQLSGTTAVGDTLKARFGVVGASRSTVYGDIEYGIISAHVALRAGGRLLLKCQDQVNGGHVRWMQRDLANFAEANGFRLEDMFLVRSYRAQPHGTAQQHARRNLSQLMVLRKTKPLRSRTRKGTS